MNSTSNNVTTLNTTAENWKMKHFMDSPWGFDESDFNIILFTICNMVIRNLQLLFGAITNIITVIVICKTDKLRTAGNQLVIGLAIADAFMFLGEYK